MYLSGQQVGIYVMLSIQKYLIQRYQPLNQVHSMTII